MKGLRLYLIGSAIALIVYLVAQYYKPQPTNWTASYLKEDKIPYGLYILKQRITDVMPGAKVEVSRQPVYNTLKGRHFKNSSYLFVAGSINIDSLDFVQLKSYMNQGNDVFIATFNLGRYLSHTLKTEMNAAVLTKGKGTPVNFVNPALRSAQDYVFDKNLGCMYFSRLDSAKVTVLGKNVDGGINFIKYAFGKGTLYILPNPQLLTNYNLLNPAGADYVAKTLSYLPDTKTLIWDEYNTRGNVDDESPLRVFFKYDQLRWAYYLALAGLVIFVLFEIKRRQRIIPIITPLRNTSVDFVKVVGRLYYQQRNHNDMAHKKINYLMEYIRSNYRLKTTTIDQEFETALAQKSGIDQQTIRGLIQIIQTINHSTKVSDEQLIELSKWIEKFYKKA
jgi:hypothetical protein